MYSFVRQPTERNMRAARCFPSGAHHDGAGRGGGEYGIYPFVTPAAFKRYNVNLNGSLAELKFVDYRRKVHLLYKDAKTSEKSLLCIPTYCGCWKLPSHVSKTNQQGVLNES